MANMCHNYVEIEASAEDGGEEQIRALFELVGKEFDFNKIIPAKDLDRADTIEAWGCQSIGFDVDYHEQSKDCHEWYFWTKWVPPVRIYEKLCEMFPNVLISWKHEVSNGHSGDLSEGY